MEKPDRGFVGLPMCTMEFPREETVFLRWSSVEMLEPNGETTTLTYITKTLDKPYNKLRIVIDATEMTIDFVRNHLLQWISQLEKTRGWLKIAECYVVTTSYVLKYIADTFSFNGNVYFETDLKTACSKVELDPDTLISTSL